MTDRTKDAAAGASPSGTGAESESIDETRTDKPATVEKSPPAPAHKLVQKKGEIGGPAGPEPTRYGDWSHKGIVSDF
ncbi:succinate dehydrogenase assembly factor 4 [Oceanibacterium hippocampi]|uniref:DUF1674 domain-containing protein n=1 Tax=Oceanibacterium hippocampi TaxID=745714 RepID=A0A1Y5RE56_9PROT|nr:succinate dehydrogenase assembly factor 4 [Oceanibacterium hippocampi]SLN15417.1 hypothetical protein OCH7691_00317 [Oceanibacterium hippocampi]